LIKETDHFFFQNNKIKFLDFPIFFAKIKDSLERDEKISLVKQYNHWIQNQTIKIENNGSILKIFNFPKDKEILLDQTMSYTKLGAEFSADPKNDDTRHFLFLRKEYLELRNGLLIRLIEFLENNIRKPYKIIQPKQNIQFLDLQYRGPPLWQHQNEALAVCLNKQNGLVFIPTGGGKTFLMTKLTAERNVKTNIFINSVDVAYQLLEAFEKNLSEPIGFIGDQTVDICAYINIILLPTAYLALQKTGCKILTENKIAIESEYNFKEIKIPERYHEIVEIIKQADMSLFDETDVLGAKTYAIVSQNTNSYYNFGFSATPWRNDGKDMEIEAGLGRKIFEISMQELIDQNILVPAKIHILEIPGDISPVPKAYPSIFKLCIVNNETRNLMIRDICLNEVGNKGIILVNRLYHGRNLKKILTAVGLNVTFIHGDHSIVHRKKAITLLETGELDVIITTLFARGTNIPSLDYLIRACAEGTTPTGKPNTNLIQMTGRVIRSFKHKTEGRIYDFYDPYPKLLDHSKARVFTYESEPAFKIIWKKL